MAATTASTQPLDLSKPASFPIRLGNSLTQSPEAVDPYAVKLDIQDGQWSYDGRPAQDVGDNYVLILRGEGSKKEAVLERIHAGYEFNLTSTPNEADSEALRKQYPHLEDAGQATDGDELFGDESNDEEPLDPSNPFDYRHHLNTAMADHHNKQHEPPPSSKPTPRAQPTRPASSTPLARPTHKRQASNHLFAQQPKKRKPPTSDAPTPSQTKGSTAKTSTKKPKPDAHPSTTSPSTSSRNIKQPPSTTRKPPEIRLDRQASSAHQQPLSSSPHHHEAEDEDSASDEAGGELILENDEASHSRRHPHHTQHQGATASKGKARNAGAMSLALSGQLGAGEQGAGGGGGPISLRSAASSPASRIDSPGGLQTSAGKRQLGGWGGRTGEGRGHGGGGEDEEEGGDDADVEDLELPSPANGSAGRDERGGGGEEGVVAVDQEEEEEDDLDAQLAAAMAQDDGGGGQGEQFVQEEEEEESEEE
ncbi:hypothetical protein KC364_g11332 [Hortaea werneckii]|nr:hypothetical protein KC364_g11332 [Hortaea werneckii]